MNGCVYWCWILILLMIFELLIWEKDQLISHACFVWSILGCSLFLFLTFLLFSLFLFVFAFVFVGLFVFLGVFVLFVWAFFFFWCFFLIWQFRLNYWKKRKYFWKWFLFRIDIYCSSHNSLTSQESNSNTSIISP
jgi:hypothetical protein